MAPEKKRHIYHLDRGWIEPDSIDFLPPEPGAYGLLIRLERQFYDQIGALGQVKLIPGIYLYLGSANGPGGLPARLRRHVRAEKRTHWHVDHLTGAGSVERVFVLPNGRECELVDAACRLPDIQAPIAGFGSSDCPRCKAHLLAVRGKRTALFKAFASMT